jgi:hypothetical protein
MRVPNQSSTVAFYKREFVTNDMNQLVAVWPNISILTAGSVDYMQNDPTLLEVIVPYNKGIQQTMRVRIDNDQISYAIQHVSMLGVYEFSRLVVDLSDTVDIPPITETVGPITENTTTTLIGFLRGDGYRVYADSSGGGQQIFPVVSIVYDAGKIVRVNYSDGSYKSISYNSNGTIDTIIWSRLTDTVTSTLVYNLNGTISQILTTLT